MIIWDLLITFTIKRNTPMNRITKDEYFLQMAILASKRGTCPRRQVGAIMVNVRRHVLSTGYNGVPVGVSDCGSRTSLCKGKDFKSGKGLSECHAVHAEANALLQCKDVYEIETAYLTDAPCIDCTKLLLNTGCLKIIFLKRYAHTISQRLWTQMGRQWEWVEKVI